MTATTNKAFKMDCYIYDFQYDYTYTWYKNGHEITNFYRLKQNELVVLPDEYYYQKNNFDVAKRKYLKSMQNKQGGSNNDNTGTTYDYMSDDDDYINDDNTQKVYGSRLSFSMITFVDKGTYECVAKRADGRGSEHRTNTTLSTSFGSSSNSNNKKNNISKMPPSRCEKYQGNYCEILKGYSIRLEGFQAINDIEDEVKMIVERFDSYVDQNRNSGASTCSTYLKDATCLYVFNICSEQLLTNPTSTKLKPLKLCREDCELLTHLNCKKPYEALKTQVQEFKIAEKLNCTSLTPTDPSGQKCLPTGLPTYNNDTQSCYETEITSAIGLATVNQGSSHKYYGLASKADDGSECLRWSDPKLLAMYPRELAGGHNYCRSIKGAGLVSHGSMSSQEIKVRGF